MSAKKVLLAFYFVGLTLIHRTQASNNPDDVVKAHNIARDEVGTPPLEWDDEIATSAQSCADELIKTCDFRHSDTPYGENIALGNSEAFTMTDAVKSWIDEKPHYDHESNTCIGHIECMHYTQVVSQNSFNVGCGRASCDSGNVIVVCHYDPNGNNAEDKPY